MTVELYSKPACVQCTQSKKTLEKLGVEFVESNVVSDEAAYDFVTKTLGYSAAPVLVVKDNDGNVIEHWSGFEPEKLNKLAS